MVGYFKYTFIAQLKCSVILSRSVCCFWTYTVFTCIVTIFHKGPKILRSVDPASLYNLVNKSNWVYNSVRYIYLFFFSTCFGHPCAHHQEETDTGICHSVRVAIGMLVGLNNRPDDAEQQDRDYLQLHNNRTTLLLTNLITT